MVQGRVGDFHAGLGCVYVDDGPGPASSTASSNWRAGLNTQDIIDTDHPYSGFGY